MRESKDSLDRKILQLLYHNHQLTPERIIRAAHLIRENTTIDFLFTTFEGTALTQEQFGKIAESIATNRDLGTLKKQTKFSEILGRIKDANHLIRIIRNPDISLEIKKLTINRLAILNLWDDLAHSLSYSGDKDLSIEIMKKLTPELTPERIIIAAAAQNQDTIILLMEKAKQINLNDDQIIRFREEIAKTLDDGKADEWVGSYPRK